jgi:glycosyltransferase involved in cell wall biosynthesis
MKEANSHDLALSVIVPCYNVEQFLDRLFNCLERQWDGRTDYEIILVNDASTDRTIDKLNTFKSRFPDHVIVIDKKINEGAGRARNSGLDVARGNWVVFVDPDDALKPNSYGRMIGLLENAAEDIDILSFGVEIVNEEDWNDSLIEPDFDGHINSVFSSTDFILNHRFATSIKYLYKRSMIADHRFPQLIFLEDVLFTLPLLLKKLRIAITEEKVYYYIVRKTSATTSANSVHLNKGCDDIMTAIETLQTLKEGQDSNVQKRIAEHQSFYSLNLFTRLLLSNKSIKEITRIRKVMEEMSLYPLTGYGNKLKLYNYLFKHPVLLSLFRPIYRQIRKR